MTQKPEFVADSTFYAGRSLRETYSPYNWSYVLNFKNLTRPFRERRFYTGWAEYNIRYISGWNFFCRSQQKKTLTNMDPSWHKISTSAFCSWYSSCNGFREINKASSINWLHKFFIQIFSSDPDWYSVSTIGVKLMIFSEENFLLRCLMIQNFLLVW